MIIGTVDASGDALVPLRVRGPRGQSLGFQVVIDTGFNDWLTLPVKVIRDLGLQLREECRYSLADGSIATSRLCAAEVEWLGQWRRILASEMDGDPLLGMALLNGSRVEIEVIDGGRVQIGPLSE